MRLAAIVMEIPISCERCPLLDWDLDYIKCKATDRHFSMAECWRSNRVPDCPLIEIPTHGRLIEEADAIETVWMILRGLGYLKEENLQLEQTVREVFATTPAIEVEEHG